MPTTVQRQKKVYAIEKVPEEESPSEYSDSEYMGDAIREHSDEEQAPRGEFLVEYQEETPLEIQEVQLEAGIPQDSAKITCANTNIPGPTNQRNGIHTGNSHRDDCLYWQCSSSIYH
ncbi:hypothetical protein O181_095803 [Austropuccinia psidii MF-1]|uniref:Uncharacterized protein n=1 Tax=Austropuccinia psidii MF-1 TaxID=1389203 RepID=A0A9Q3J4K6_9BASI|nr:hypothetical protein [Austropuccinia psidii MF-1]